MTRRWWARPTLWIAVALLAAASTVIVGGLWFNVPRASKLSQATCEPTRTAGQVVQVSLMGGTGMMGTSLMMLGLTVDRTSVPSGRVTFVVTNYGWVKHEFLVFPMPVNGLGTRPVGSDGKIDESGSLGEASTSCGAGPGNGIMPGARSWVTLTLGPGRYEVLCDMPWHYANGMYSSFTVA